MKVKSFGDQKNPGSWSGWVAVRNGLLMLGCAWLMTPVLWAHYVPNLVLEVDVTSATRKVELRLNLDPRLFLAEDPRDLPPVPASWYLEQSIDEKAETERRALEFVRAALTLLAGGEGVEIKSWRFEPIDGATGLALDEEAEEVHLVAITDVELPVAAPNPAVRLESATKVALVLLMSLDQEEERSPQILFPGETSSPLSKE
jgi:hypothetical protein